MVGVVVVVDPADQLVVDPDACDGARARRTGPEPPEELLVPSRDEQLDVAGPRGAESHHAVGCDHRSSRESRRSFEHPAAGLAGRAVEDRVLLEVDLRDRRPADVARLAEPAVDAVRLLVGGARLAQLEAALELGVHRGREPLHLFVVEIAGECVRRELRRVEDLVRPRAADARDQALVAKQRVQPPRLAVDDLAQPLRPEPERLRAEVRELGLGRLRA